MRSTTRGLIRRGALALSVAVIAGMAVAPAASAADDQLTPESVQAALEGTARVSGIPSVLEGARTRSDARRGVDSTLTIETPRAEAVTIEPQSRGEAVSLPSGLTSFIADDGVATVPVPKTDGSVQVATVIANADSPTMYAYTIGAGDGSKLIEVDKGYVAIADAEGNLIAGVAPAWAVDANGDQVPTWFEIDGDTLVQHVDHSAAYEYPIVADPWVGGAWLEEYSWLTSYRVSYRPTWWGSWGCFGSVSCASAWQATAQSELVNAQTNGTYSARAGYSTTRNQIGCHMFGAGAKSPWNLETNVGDLGLAGFISVGCNP